MIVIYICKSCGDLYDFSGVNYDIAMQILIAYTKSHHTLNDWNNTPVKFKEWNSSCNGCR